jgi:hypothetical protein
VSGTRLVWLATGKHDARVQALYSLYSALAFKGDADATLHIYTDAPDVYQPIAEFTRIHELTPAKIDAMKGKSRHPFRMKLALVAEELRSDRQSPVIFVDADTFFFREFGSLLSQIDSRNAVMHIREWHVASAMTGQMRRFRRNMRRVKYQGGPVNVDVYMWNSGVIGVHPACLPVVDEALAFCDVVWEKYSKPFVEQFAVSWCLQRAGISIHPADGNVFHYWYQKPEYLKAIGERLEQWRDQPVDTALDEIRRKRLVLAPPPRKLSLREKVVQRLSGRAIPDVRGLP